LYTFLISPMCATCLTHLILLDLIIVYYFVKAKGILNKK
jgi:hypothetical protein